MEQRLVYINNGRGGYVVYENGQEQIKFPFEYGGGNCLVIIDVPTILEWTSETNLPITERQLILTFVAEQSVKDQAPNGYYEISGNCIEIYSMKTY